MRREPTRSSSRDSRIRTATFGHNGSAWESASVDAAPASGSGTGSGSDGNDGSEDESDDGNGDGSGGSDSLPGPGVLGTITSMVGAGYLLKRGTDENDEE